MRFGSQSRAPRAAAVGPWTFAGLCLWAIAIWTPALASAKSAADYFVHSLPGAPEGPLLKMHAGLVEVDEEHHGSLFFWLFQNRHIANKQRTIIWLNGGPGCSSEDGALMEVGPYRVVDDHLVYNEGSWDEFANLVFVDNPVGTGFSVVDTNSYVHDLQEMADHFVNFLQAFFELFPEYESDDLYLTGESWAGQHIPYIAKAILERNKKTSGHVWNLVSMVIGNGWISPVDQYPSYVAYAYDKGIIKQGSSEGQQVETELSLCNQALGAEGGQDKIEIPQCEQVMQRLLALTQTTEGDVTMCINMYDVRLRDTYPSCGMNWPPDLKDVTPYLRRQDVLQAINLGGSQQPGWTECSGAVGGALNAPHAKPSFSLLPELLESSVQLVLFSGEEDLICNHIGTENLINRLSWSGGTGFELSPGTWAPRREWTFEGEPAGMWQSARNLTYILFHNSSHMVPFDWARRSRDMLDRVLGVDISQIGGAPADSRLDGEKGPATSVGSHPNSSEAEAEERQRIATAKWAAYQKSAEVVLVIVAIAAAAWGFFVWRDRRSRAGYRGLASTSRHDEAGAAGAAGLDGFRRKTARPGDVEAADFDETELDDLHAEPHADAAPYDIGSASEDEGDDAHATGKAGRGKSGRR